MIAQARRAYLLCDSAKIGHTYFHHLCSVRSLTGVICEQPLPEPLTGMCGGAGGAAEGDSSGR